VQGFGASLLAADRYVPRPSGDHSRRGPVPLELLTRRPKSHVAAAAGPVRLCNEGPF
jgi:hypothetical protein